MIRCSPFLPASYGVHAAHPTCEMAIAAMASYQLVVAVAGMPIVQTRRSARVFALDREGRMTARRK